MKDVRIIYLPEDIWRGVQAMGLAPQVIAEGGEEFCKHFSEQDLATIEALQNHPTITRTFGGVGSFIPSFSAKGWDRYQNVIQPLAKSSYILERVAHCLAGTAPQGSAPFTVVDLAPRVIGVIMGAGAIEALQRDNNVLEVLTSIVQRALFYGTVSDLMVSQIAGVFERFVAVNAFANPLRPPSPAYR